jgi:thiol:disulfide interchange protein DsbD
MKLYSTLRSVYSTSLSASSSLVARVLNRTIPLLLVCLLAAGNLFAQIVKDPTTWAISAKKKQGNQYEIVFSLKLKTGWHIWALKPGGDGLQVPPEFKFAKNADLTLSGAVKEKGHPVTGLMDGVDGTVTYFHDEVTYIQLATIARNTKITGTYMYQVCDDKMCLPPKEVPFALTVTDAGGDLPDTTTAAAPAMDTTAAAPAPVADTAKAVAATAPVTGDDNKPKEESGGGKSLLWLFLAAIGGGLAAVITPCVYSMIPITVSFFTKRSKTRKEGIRNALYYSLSIIIIFTVLGVAISAIFGSNALNTLSTNWIANMFFFVIFVVFGISFLGAFEITLPSSWTNKTDSKAGVGSFGGIFFMALTLAIVSFSCTGPIVGPLLVLAGKGGIAGPTVGMFGFSIGLALPFALFAIFPGMLNKMAQSGGWLNQVKVILGFLELMLALKFFSNADLAMGWRLLDRELFIAAWVVIAFLLGMYLLGKLKMSHDDAPPKNVYGQEYVSVLKLFLAVAAFAFSAYLLPGMWGAPLNGMSAFLPPIGTFDSFGGGSAAAPAHAEGDARVRPVKYVEDMKIYEPPVVKNLGLVTYFEYEEALAAAKILKKPIMLDFTGINCVNCRKMESQVWSDPQVAKRLKEDFIVASLYCDMNRIKLPAAEQYFSKDLNAQISSVGNKNADIQAAKFGSNSQPFYFYVDENGDKLVPNGYSYDPDIKRFVAHLDKVIAAYKAKHP